MQSAAVLLVQYALLTLTYCLSEAHYLSHPVAHHGLKHSLSVDKYIKDSASSESS